MFKVKLKNEALNSKVVHLEELVQGWASRGFGVVSDLGCGLGLS